MQLALVVLAVIVGMLLPAQAAMNGTLGKVLGHPILASIANFIVGFVALGVATLGFSLPWPDLEKLKGPPWWAWLGGFCGASLVVVAATAAPRIGPTLLVAALIAGQLLSSVLLDHFGVLGLAPRPFNAMKACGVGLLLLGLLVLYRSD